MGENLIPIVNRRNKLLGYMDKMEAHEKGVLHRAFSGLVFDKNNNLYLQKRAEEKYHCPGLWSNTVCSHPKSNIIKNSEIEKRLYEEMGMTCSNFIHLFDFVYKKEFDNGLIEHELDSVYVGFSDDIPKTNLEEVSDYKLIKPRKLYGELKHNPAGYTFWFKEICKRKEFKRVLKKFNLI